MFRAVYRSLSGPLTVFAASGLHAHVVNGRSQVCVGTQTWLRPVTTCACKPEAAKTERLMMSGIPLETCWAFNEWWNNKFCYKVASCWLFLLNHTTVPGSMNIKCHYGIYQRWTKSALYHIAQWHDNCLCNLSRTNFM